MDQQPYRETVLLLLCATTAATLSRGPALAAQSAPPETPRRIVQDTLHGDTIDDPYRWLEPLEAESPEVREWTEAQNLHTRAVLFTACSELL